MILSSLIVAEARGWIGTPYRHQASLKGVGCDCLGLLRGVWRGVFGTEPESPPPYTPDWAEASGKAGGDALLLAARRHLHEIPLSHADAGDVLLFRWREGVAVKHCAIATAPDAMIHAHDGACVAEVAIGPWWRRHLVHAFRFPGKEP